MKIALIFFLLYVMGLWSFKITNAEDVNTNLLSNEENVDNSNLFKEKISKEFQKRWDAVIGTEYWGRKKRNMNRCER